eukprot:scaffold1170_cov139-Skeletonema_dohrnii-CCMP3373.AAC.1
MMQVTHLQQDDNRNSIMPPKKKTNSKGAAGSGGGDWLASLARQSTASDVVQSSTSKRKGAKKGAQQPTSSTSHATTKEERIQRREQKKLERQERKRLAEEKRDARKLVLQQKKRKRNERGGGGTEQIITSTSPSSANPSPIRDAPRKRKTKRGGMTDFSKRALVKLCNNIESTVSQYDDNNTSFTHKNKKHKKQKSSDQIDNDTSNQQLTINGLPADPKGKATKSSTLRPDSKELQPRIRDYNGQGLVRPSLFLPLNDPSFVPKLELEFAEHIPGFFGKAKTKAAKKQSDENMLWRRCLKAKEEEG